MGRQYQAADVAACIINMANEGENQISNLQLQKILFFCQCKCLQDTGHPLFSDDVVAWQYGPVIKDVYYSYSYRGASKILESDTTTIDSETKQLRQILLLEKDARAIVKHIYDRYGKQSAWSLVRLTHAPNSAWYKVYNKNGEGSGYDDVIPHLLMAQEHVE